MLKLISINIERDKHHDTVMSFLKNEQPDVVCLQEVFLKDLSEYEKLLNMKSFFKPMCYYSTFIPGEDGLLGVAILARNLKNYNHEYIIGNETNIPKFKKPKDPQTERNDINIVLLWTDVLSEDNVLYKIATTHFTWTPEGTSTEYQKEDARNAIKVLETRVKNFVLTGDLNAVRGRDTFTIFAEKWKDNIPEEYDSSLDPKLHRVPDLRYMVDGLFTTTNYIAEGVKLVSGVSDHKAIVANIKII